MLITYYNPETFQRIGTIARAISVIHNKRMYSIGSIEITLDKYTEAPPLDSLILYKGISGIVMEVNDSKQWRTVLCYDIKGITQFRQVESEITYTNKTPEYIIKDMAEKMLATGDRAIDGLRIVEDSGDGDLLEAYTVPVGNFGDFLEKFCTENQIGYDVTFDENEIVFDVIKQKENENAIFSSAEGTLDESEYVASNYDMKNVAYYKNEDETISFVGEGNGIMRREEMCDEKAEAESCIKENCTRETISGTAGMKLRYGIDYNIGDVVNVVHGTYATKKVISEIEQAWESGFVSETPIFGDELINPIKKMLGG